MVRSDPAPDGPPAEAPMILRSLAVFGAFLASLSLAVPAFADDVMLVVDSSASMAGKLGRDRKADLVADAIQTAVADFPTEARIGLLAFGGRSKASCSDAEVRVRPQQDGNDLVAAAATGLQPRGKAALAVAIDRAANALDYRHQRATLVVFVDKIESCEADPCVLAESLKQKAKDLTIEVIGLGLDDTEIPSAACIAEKTGGKFLNAMDGTDLGGGLAAALASAKAPPENLPFASIEAPSTIQQSQAFSVGYDGPKAKDDRIEIAWPGLPPGSEIRSVLVGADGARRSLKAPAEAGTYEIRYYHPELNAILASRTIDVTVTPVSVSAPASVAAGAPFQIAWTGPAAPFDEIRILPAGGGPIAAIRVSKTGRPVSLEAPLQAGSYEAQYHVAAEDNVGASTHFTVDPPAASLKAPATAEAGSRIIVTWSGPGARFDDIVVAVPGAAPTEHVTMARVRSNYPEVRLTTPKQPGRYEIRYIAGDGKAIFAAEPLTVR
jgi:Ca-activated chloride channel family protein